MYHHFIKLFNERIKDNKVFNPFFINKYAKRCVGRAIQETSWKFPSTTLSLCPECASVIPARKYIEDNIIWMEKVCTKHKYYKELLSPNAELYINIFGKFVDDSFKCVNTLP